MGGVGSSRENRGRGRTSKRDDLASTALNLIAKPNGKSRRGSSIRGGARVEAGAGAKAGGYGVMGPPRAVGHGGGRSVASTGSGGRSVAGSVAPGSTGGSGSAGGVGGSVLDQLMVVLEALHPLRYGESSVVTDPTGRSSHIPSSGLDWLDLGGDDVTLGREEVRVCLALIGQSTHDSMINEVYEMCGVEVGEEGDSLHSPSGSGSGSAAGGRGLSLASFAAFIHYKEEDNINALQVNVGYRYRRN